MIHPIERDSPRLSLERGLSHIQGETMQRDAVVFAVADQPVTDPQTGISGYVRKGSHWPADDPVVKNNPGLFSADPRFGLNYSVEPDGYDAPVETATAAPGEKRQVRRG